MQTCKLNCCEKYKCTLTLTLAKLSVTVLKKDTVLKPSTHYKTLQIATQLGRLQQSRSGSAPAQDCKP